MKVVKKLKLQNFKRFRDIEIEFDDQLNILVGDNECGKSTILLALDLVLSGSRSKVETLGLQNLINSIAISEFLSGDKAVDALPTLRIELYLNEQNNFELNGVNHTDKKEKSCDGLKLVCEPMHGLSKEIKEILSQTEENFPFEYYSIQFSTFSDTPYTGYRKYLKHLLLDGSQINNEYATQEYVKAIYGASVVDIERFKHRNEYRNYKSNFTKEVLKSVNDKLSDYSFSVRTTTKSNLETDMTILEGSIPIDNKGKGRQCFIKTEFALGKTKSDSGLDVLLLEEPENHLSHINMNRLIKEIAKATTKQLFIATHSNLVSTRLDLRKAILLNSNSEVRTMLSELPADTARFFMKAPDNNILEFVLSRKVLLVEGDADFILMELFFRTVTGKELASSNVHVVSVGGTSFKRYLDIAELLGIKTAVIRDNDGDPQENCVDRYSDYVCDSIAIFYDSSPARHTFEVCLYEENKAVCDDLFKADRKKLSVVDYMLKNKADAAFALLDKKSDALKVPTYIKDAIEWISG